MCCYAMITCTCLQCSSWQGTSCQNNVKVVRIKLNGIHGKWIYIKITSEIDHILYGLILNPLVKLSVKYI